MVKCGRPAGELVWLVVGGGDRGHEPDAVGDGGERGENGDVVRASGDVELVQTPGVLAHPQVLREEEEVEFGALGRLREVHERGSSTRLE